ncbi:MAG TPA: FecR domain-containing protein [Ignavibacteriaceae bacterium]|nr:FecR domain-containing protein [Ignavibacteriaceae bacterium]
MDLLKTIDFQFLVRIVKNEVGQEEREFFQGWLEQSEENKEKFSSFLVLWDKIQTSRKPSLPPQEIEWEKIESKILTDQSNSIINSLSVLNKEPQEIVSPYKSNKVQTTFVWILRIAAVFVAGLPLFFLQHNESPKKEATVSKVEVPQVKYYTLSTANGQRATMNLSDGSVISLNADSKLKYPNYFDKDSREIEFEGEGYFKIHPDKTRPFRIKCNNTITEVTGTEFNIKNRNHKFSIAVVEGSVKMFSNKTSQEVAVVKGQMVSLKNSGSFSKPLKINVKHLLAWRENKLSFSRTPLNLAVKEIERCYSNVNITIVNDSLKHKTITGVFDTGSLDEILSVLSITHDIKINKKGHQIYFE